ncbi:MAG: mycofactocin-associated electron transfer flavoprotein beta subunit [Acidimicrobiales bacterium]
MSPPDAAGRLLVVACMKRVELRAGVDPLTGTVIADRASAGPSRSDEAALEWALRIAERTGGEAVALTAGDADAEDVLRGAIAAGAERAVRVPLAASAPSAAAADALSAGVQRLVEVRGSTGFVVCCGDASVDHGSGSVPAFLAARLGAVQALGLVAVAIGRSTEATEPRGGSGGDGSGADGSGGAGSAPRASAVSGAPTVVLEVERRLDGGRRERLALRPPCVISVEAVTARLRRATLGRALSATHAEIEVLGAVLAAHPAPDAHGASGHAETTVELVGVEPFRPRTRVVPPPRGRTARERILTLTGALHERPTARTLTLGPEQAADALLTVLAEWGELPQWGELAQSGELPQWGELADTSEPASPGETADPGETARTPPPLVEDHDEETEIS